MTASYHHVLSHSHIQTQVVSQFHTAQSIQSQKEIGGEKTRQTQKLKGRQRPDIGGHSNTFRAHPLPGKR